MAGSIGRMIEPENLSFDFPVSGNKKGNDRTMKKNKELYRIINNGGVLSPALLARILQAAESAGNQHVFLGSRQDILFYLPSSGIPSQPEFSELSLYKRSSGIQNVVSSYVCVDILPSSSWVYSGIYLKVLDLFTYKHLLRVNIVDPCQNLVPLFYGHLNFIASETPNYWHLYLNLDVEKDPQQWSGLIFTDDIPEFAKELEQLILGRNMRSCEQLKLHLVGTDLQKNTLESSGKIKLPTGFFPYYEGLNKLDGKDRYWAGFYWRNNRYPIRFLKEVCELCQRTNVGKICFTPWKTFLIKDIEQSDKIYWDELIGRYGINMRHSSFELNWHLPLLDESALKLKRYLVSEFDKFDIRTFGLSFAVQNKPGERFTTLVVHSKGRFPFLGEYDFTRTYSIEHAFDYNPNSNKYIVYAENLKKAELPQLLNELSKRYFAQLFIHEKKLSLPKTEKTEKKALKVHQCPDCLSVYDERFGDELARISAGVSFVSLPENYACQICETPKQSFSEIEIQVI